MFLSINIKLRIKNCRQSSTAFTLLEMSIVLIIMASLLGGGITTFLAYTAKEGYKNTENRLKEIEAALVQYKKAFNRLPCPGDITLVIETANFGKEANNKGTCTGGALAANFSSGNMVSGLVPVRALGLDDEYAFDSWGRRIRYMVDRRYTEDLGMLTYQGTPISKAYALISHGANGHGGYPRGGGNTMFNSNSINAKEQTNCSCDSNAAFTSFTGNFSEGIMVESTTDARDSFDDVVLSVDPILLGMKKAPDLLWGSSYTVDSTYGGYTGHSAASGVGLRDGIYIGGASVWGSNAGSGGWIKVDFGAVVNIKSIEVAAVSAGFGWGINYTNNAKLQVSNDDSTWSDLITLTGLADGISKTYVLDSITGRYLRIMHPSNQLGIGDWKIYYNNM